MQPYNLCTRWTVLKSTNCAKVFTFRDRQRLSNVTLWAKQYTQIVRFTLNNLRVKTCRKESSDETNGKCCFLTLKKQTPIYYFHPIYALQTLVLHTFSPKPYFDVKSHQLILDTYSPLYIMQCGSSQAKWL